MTHTLYENIFYFYGMPQVSYLDNAWIILSFYFSNIVKKYDYLFILANTVYVMVHIDFYPQYMCF